MGFKGTRWIAALAAALGLAGCGGGDQVERYVPQRIIVFGDEMSVLESDGRKYTVNAINSTTGAIDCLAHPLWIQDVAHGYGMAFPQCPNGSMPQTAETRASVGAKVADVTARVDAFLAETSNPPKREDLVLMMVGTHDVLELFNESPRRSEADMLAELDARGTQLATQVNRIVRRSAGNPVVIASTIPLLGQTPFGVASTEAALLSRMTEAFNSALRRNMEQDGRLVGLVFADGEIDQSVRNPDSRGYTVVDTAACTVALPDCTTSTLASGATVTTHVWADSLRPGPRFHDLLGSGVFSRAVNNPF